ncbi:MAG TPA: hypothetical protein VKM94_24390 [Blastocatellia bacterium]|nr:hypothetical protein [Blastocatellia bacterium]
MQFKKPVRSYPAVEHMDLYSSLDEYSTNRESTQTACSDDHDG